MGAAGAFEGDNKRPDPLFPRKKGDTDKAKSHRKDGPAMSHNAAIEVTIRSDGNVEHEMSTADVCKTLGLDGDGTGQCVGLRSFEVLLGTGMSTSATSAKIITLNSSTAKIAVEGERLLGGITHKQKKRY